MTLLSICIPTFNRAGPVFALVEALHRVPGDFEICIHDDGSSDGTCARLAEIGDPRLRLSRSANGGRAQALRAAIGRASGHFAMIHDDDDMLHPEGLATVLADCAAPLPEGCAGFVYHLEDDLGQRIGGDFPVARSNLVALRADCGVTGDKREVVLRPLLLAAMDVPGTPCRVPTSLYWTRLACSHDILCRNVTIGRKSYLAGGMSDRIAVLKAANPRPMYLLARARVAAFAAGRYRSPGFLLRSLAGVAFHGARAVLGGARRQGS